MSNHGRSARTCCSPFISCLRSLFDNIISTRIATLSQDSDGFQDILSAVQVVDETVPLLAHNAVEGYRYLTGRTDSAQNEDDDSNSGIWEDAQIQALNEDWRYCHNAPLCNTCRRLAHRLHSHTYNGDVDEGFSLGLSIAVRHKSYNVLEFSHHSCLLCAKIWLRLSHDDETLVKMLQHLTGLTESRLDRLKDHTIYLRGLHGRTEFRLQLFRGMTTTDIPTLAFYSPIDFTAPEGQLWWDKIGPDALGQHTKIGTYHSGHESFRKKMRLLRNWMKSCEQHDKCQKWRSSNGGWLPSRLIYVGDSLSPPRLFECDRMSKETEYATLSHCWGGSSFTKTTIASYSDWLKRLPMEELPATFIEVVDACKDIGISYLWIDSLCIIQDSDTDWEREASTMHLVYRHSSLNFAASASSRVTDGLFRSWNRFLSSNPMLHGVEGINFTGDRNLSHFHDKELLRLDFQRSRLHHRAWVVQELFLAPRTLHFTTLNLWWQCKQCMFSGWRFPNDSMFEVGRDLPCVYAFVNLENDKQSLLKAWNALVEDYSAAGLTYAEDKVMAFQGISQFFLDQMRSLDSSEDLLAGLWSSQICTELLWFTASRVVVGTVQPGPLIFILEENRAVRHNGDHGTAFARGDPIRQHSQQSERLASASQRVAPTWSWLSTQVPISRSLTQYVGDVSWFSSDDGFKPCAQLVSFNKRMLSPQRFSRDTSLTLIGPYFWIRVEQRLPFLVPSRGTYPPEAKPHSNSSRSGSSSETRNSQPTSLQAHVQCFFDDAYHRDDGALYYCFATLQHDAMPWIFRGIILQDVSGGDSTLELGIEDEERPPMVATASTAANAPRNPDLDGDILKGGGRARLERVGIWCSDAAWVDKDPRQLAQLRWLQKEGMQVGEATIY